jgi:LacI family transcriptional regulator
MPIAKYLTIIDSIEKEFINNPEWKERSIPSIRKLCDRYGVSLLTVNKSIDELKNRGLLYGEYGRGVYIAQKNVGAAQEPLKKLVVFTREIVSASVQKYEMDIMSGLQGVAQNNAVEILHIQVKESFNCLEEVLKRKLLKEAGVAFVVIFEDENVHDLIEALKRHSKPFVVIANEHVDGSHLVDFDLKQGIHAGLRDMVKQGCSQIHYLGPEDSGKAFKTREKTFERFLKRYELEFQEHLHIGPPNDMSSKSGYELMKALHEKGTPFDGIFVADDRMALGVMIYLTKHGIDCPMDICLFSVGNNKAIDEEFIPTISSVDYEGREIGRQAFWSLLEGKESKMVKSTYVKRESTSRLS